MDAFGSIGLYNTDGYCKENKYNAYSVNTINATPNEDGSLTFYIQKESPGKELEANWLPAPDGPLYVMMKLYGP